MRASMAQRSGVSLIASSRLQGFCNRTAFAPGFPTVESSDEQQGSRAGSNCPMPSFNVSYVSWSHNTGSTTETETSSSCSSSSSASYCQTKGPNLFQTLATCPRVPRIESAGPGVTAAGYYVAAAGLAAPSAADDAICASESPRVTDGASEATMSPITHDCDSFY